MTVSLMENEGGNPAILNGVFGGIYPAIFFIVPVDCARSFFSSYPISPRLIHDRGRSQFRTSRGKYRAE